MTDAHRTGLPADGLRERKRKETSARITEAGIRLFLLKGFEATTLDEIAGEAGISRRTFFYYFKSKDDILLSLQVGMGDMIVDALREEPMSKPPLEAVRDAILRACVPFPPEEMIAMDRLMRSSDVVWARKQASYIEHEATLFAGLRDRWPEPERETALRLVAMLAIGAIRLSLEALNRENGQRPLPTLLSEAFNALRDDVCAGS